MYRYRRRSSSLDLNVVYAEIGANYRMYAGRRLRIIVGYVTLWAAVLSGLWTVSTFGTTVDGKKWTGALLVVALVATFILWRLESRNRELVDCSKTCGEACEKGLRPKCALYSTISTMPESPHAHATTIRLAFLAGPILALLCLLLQTKG